MCTVGMTNYANDIFKYCFISSNMSREDEQFKRDTERALAFSEKESRSKEQQDMDKALALSLKERTTAAALARHPGCCPARHQEGGAHQRCRPARRSGWRWSSGQSGRWGAGSRQRPTRRRRGRSDRGRRRGRDARGAAAEASSYSCTTQAVGEKIRRRIVIL
jgi:hypothetical protein